jgi:integrase
MKKKITGKALAAQRGPFMMWDAETKGLFARRQSDAGKITYGFRYRDATSRKRDVKLGDASLLTPDEARLKAIVEAGKVGQGDDPAASRDKARAAKTLAEVWADYDAAVVSKKRGRTPEAYRSLWKKHVGPRVGAIKIDRLSFEDVEQMHSAITELGGKRDERGHRHGGPVAANRARNLLSGICRRAMTKKWISANPCVGVEPNPETPKDIRFSNAELALILRALGEESEDVQIAFGLFLETPVRHSNVAASEWSEFVDLEGDAPVWRIPGDKLKGGEPYEAHLSPELADRINNHRERLREVSPRFLFPRQDRVLNGKNVVRRIDPEKPRLRFQSAWKRIAARALKFAGKSAADYAALKNGSVHTFKHTYLTRLADLGASAAEIQAMGDHADYRTSMGYVHGARSRIRDLARQARAGLPKAAR